MNINPDQSQLYLYQKELYLKKKTKIMKKFSNINEINDIEKTINPKINKLVEKLVSLNVFVSYNGNSDDILNKKTKINGVEELSEKLYKLIEEEISTEKGIILEKIKYSNIKNNQQEINKEIQLLNETKYDDIIFSPEDIFSNEDYTKDNKSFVFESLNSIPNDYLSKINRREANDYFSNGNKLSIIYEGIDKGWILSFISSNKYGISTDDDNTKYKEFIKENNDFIADFISASTSLIGTKNIKFDNKLFL